MGCFSNLSRTFPVRFRSGRPLLDVVPPEPERSPVAEPVDPSPVVSDHELLRLFSQGGHDPAFTELVHRHVHLVYSAALRQLAGNHQLAEDVTQSVFVELAKKAARLQRHPALSGWLYTTTRFMAQTVARAERRRIHREKAAYAMHDSVNEPSSPDDEPSWPRIAGVLDEAMHELSEGDLVAVVLRHFENRPFVEVGQRLGLSPNAARMRVDRALDKLRDRLAKRGITSSTAALGVALAGHAVHAAPLGLSTVVAGAAAAAAAAATAVPLVSLPALTAMMSLKSKLIVTGIVASIVVTPVALQYRTIGRLRQDLAAAQTELSDLAKAGSDARRAAELAAHENAELQASKIELLRLRGEIGPLKDQVRALTRSSTTGSAPAKAAIAPNPVPREADGRELADVGSTTAETAATSLIWAVTAGRLDRLSELIELPASVTPDDAPRHYAFFASQLGNVFAGKDFNGWKVDLKGTTNDHHVRLDLGYHDLESGNDDTFGFQLRRHADGWKVLVEGEVPESF